MIVDKAVVVVVEVVEVVVVVVKVVELAITCCTAHLVQVRLGICRVAPEQRRDEKCGHCAHALQQLVDRAGVGHLGSEGCSDVAHDLVE